MNHMITARASICLLAVFVSACSFAVEVSALPDAEFADTEASTNVALSVGAGRLGALLCGTCKRNQGASFPACGGGADSAARKGA